MVPTRTDSTRSAVSRLRMTIRGMVQGVGFRPFIHRLATGLELKGWVCNSSEGVLLEVEGAHEAVENFFVRLELEKPPHSFIQGTQAAWLDAVGYQQFEIRNSESSHVKTALVPADLATCSGCLKEIFQPDNRRYLYPFTNCTNCGPRFSIIEALPYDRARTTMKHFQLCPKCEAEFHDPTDRRFHAQPIACPECGPHLELWNPKGDVLDEQHKALLSAAEAIRRGKIVAVKGLGGFQLLAAAGNASAIRRLRDLKRRGDKPFAVMFPTLEAACDTCHVSLLEKRLLLSGESPIVLLRRKRDSPGLCGQIAPGNPELGVLLPYTPLHHLLMAELGLPAIATSGNLSEEPICIEEHEALQRLGGVADVFLVHNRPILRPVDDSVARVFRGKEMSLRRARGYAPLPISILTSNPENTNQGRIILAVGAHLKNTIGLCAHSQVFLSQHIGILENVQTYRAFQRAIKDLESLLALSPNAIVSDAHPDYLSTKFAADLASGRPELKHRLVQHHVAHALSCVAENELEGPVLGVAWDGTGYGTDGTIWGGEFFLITESQTKRVAHLRQFPLPGGEKAVREPRRAALGLLHEIFGEILDPSGAATFLCDFSDYELSLLKTAIRNRINAPLTSSAGRLFDAVASIIGVCQVNDFEGQAAMKLEFLCAAANKEEPYPFCLTNSLDNQPGVTVLDWQPIIQAILADLKHGITSTVISARFHNALVEALVAVAYHVGERQVVLTGGCFQNCYLLGQAVERLEAEGFRPYWNRRVPSNDGGIALGQILAMLRPER